MLLLLFQTYRQKLVSMSFELRAQKNSRQLFGLFFFGMQFTKQIRSMWLCGLWSVTLGKVAREKKEQIFAELTFSRGGKAMPADLKKKPRLT